MILVERKSVISEETVNCLDTYISHHSQPQPRRNMASLTQNNTAASAMKNTAASAMENSKISEQHGPSIDTKANLVSILASEDPYTLEQRTQLFQDHRTEWTEYLAQNHSMFHLRGLAYSVHDLLKPNHSPSYVCKNLKYLENSLIGKGVSMQSLKPGSLCVALYEAAEAAATTIETVQEDVPKKSISEDLHSLGPEVDAANQKPKTRKRAIPKGRMSRKQIKLIVRGP